MMHRRLLKRFVFAAFFVLLWMSVGKGQISNIEPERIITRKGFAVVRERPFFADDLVKCIDFVRIEDRTAADNPIHGYLVFLTSGGEVKLTPQAVEELFFRDELQFPQIMKPSEDLDRLTRLQESLGRVSRFNESVRSALASSLEQVTEAVKRLRNDEWWESPAGWISREGRTRRTARAERDAIDAAFGAIKRSLSAARDVNGITQTFDSFGELEELPATSSEVASYRQSLVAQLRTEAGQRSVQLENALVAEARSDLEAALEGARSLADVLSVGASVGNLANAPVSSPQALATREEFVAALSTSVKNKERKMRIKETVFDDLTAWRKTLDEFDQTGINADPEIISLVPRSEELYQQADEVSDHLVAASDNLRRFFSGLPAHVISSGEGLPPAPTDGEEVLKTYDALIAQRGALRAISVGDLNARAEFLRKNLETYRRLVAVSKRTNRHELWRDTESYGEVLNRMEAVRSAVLDEKSTYDAFLATAQRQEADNDFAAAASSFQSAHDIAPSGDLANKVKSMKDQDLGL